MVRDFIESDINEIIRLFTLEYIAMPEEIESLKAAAKILVYDDNEIQGFIRLSISGSHCYAEIGAASNELIKPVGLKLWKEAQKFLKEKSVDSVEIYHVKDNIYWQQFFNEIGFEYWYSVYRLSYTGTKFDESELCAVKYEDKYYEDKMTLECEAFTPLRRENDIKPYNWYEGSSKEDIERNREWTLKQQDYIYLFFESDEIVGASMVKAAEVDLLFVNPKYQGKGYGRKILEFAVNRGLEQNASGVNLNALASNDSALRLYRSTGFKIVQAQDIRRISLK